MRAPPPSTPSRLDINSRKGKDLIFENMKICLMVHLHSRCQVLKNANFPIISRHFGDFHMKFDCAKSDIFPTPFNAKRIYS